MRTLNLPGARITPVNRLGMMFAAIALGVGLVAGLPNQRAVATQSPPQVVVQAIGLEVYSPAWVEDGKILDLKIVIRCTPSRQTFHFGSYLTGEVEQPATGARVSFGRFIGCTPEGASPDFINWYGQTGSFSEGPVRVTMTMRYNEDGTPGARTGRGEIEALVELQA